jgi:hypothetical protein
MFFRSILAGLALLAFSQAQKLPAAIVVIEASHGGAGQDLTNTTVTIPLTQTYVHHTALAAVSTLYLVDARGVPLNSVSCTPFKHADGTGKGGLTFDSTTPSFLSTNTVQVGSIVCISTSIQLAPGLSIAPSSSASSAAASNSSSSSSSNSLTRTRHQASTTIQNTVPTQTTATAAQNTGSSTSSASVAASTGNAASNLGLPSDLFGGLALAGFGVAFAL